MSMTKSDFHALSERDRMNRVLEGTAFYASVHTPNLSAAKKFKADPFFIVNLGLEGDEVAKAKSYGLDVHAADEFIPLPYVKIKRKVKEGKTAEDVKPQVVDSMQNKVPATILIGNGSKILVKFGTYWYDNGGGGIGTSLFKVQIRELIAFDKTMDRDLKKDETGFIIPVAAEAPIFDDDDGFVDPAKAQAN